MNSQQMAEVEEILRKISHCEVRPYSTYDFGRKKDDRCRSIVLEGSERGQILTDLRKALPEGFVTFIGTGGVEIVVGPGNNQFDILRLAQTDAVNYNKSTEDIIEKLQEYDQKYGIIIWRAETDVVEFSLLKEPPNLTLFAKDLYKFCPDIVNQGSGSLHDLKEQIDITGWVYLWWD